MLNKTFLLLSLTSTMALAGPISKYNHTLKCSENCHESISKLVIESKKDGHYKCSGSLIGEDIVLTNKHCIPTGMKVGDSCKGQIEFMFPKLGDKELEIIKCDKLVKTNKIKKGNVHTLDYAIFKLDKKIKRKAFKFSKKILKEGESVWLHKVDHQVKSKIVKEECKIRFNSLAYPFSENGYSKVLTFTGCKTEPGNSGSPLLDAQGDIVGILEGRNNKKNLEFFKKHFKIKAHGVQKASNIHCLNPKGDFKKSCPKVRSSADFLKLGNLLLETQGFIPYRDEVKDSALGLTFYTKILYSDDYQENRLRPHTFLTGPGIFCLKDKKELLKYAQKMPKDYKYDYSIELGENKICELEFKFSKSMHIKKVQEKECRQLKTSFFLNLKENFLEYYTTNTDKIGKVEAWYKGTVAFCGQGEGTRQ